MRFRNRLVTLATITGLLSAPVTFGACSGYRVHDRIYDPYYGGSYRWDRAEDGRYRRWEAETHRPHVGFGRRPAEEQHAYLTWRHGR